MRIIQMTNSTHTQMMGYVFVANSGHVLAVDGGTQGDADEFSRIIAQEGGHIDLWLMTHPHFDHYGAILELADRNAVPAYDRLGSARLPDDWAPVIGTAQEEQLLEWNAFEHALDERFFEIKAGQVFELGTLKVEVLAGNNPDLGMNPINNQSCVFRLTEGDFTMLVLGDLGVEAGQRLMQTGINLKADAVQMAHHGQRGVEEAFYQAVMPTYAFWPTPDWLWENRDRNGTPGAGPFKTPEVIEWMKKLHTVNIKNFDYTVVFDTETKTVERY